MTPVDGIVAVDAHAPFVDQARARVGDELRAALVAELPDIDGLDALTVRIRAAGFEMLGQRILPHASWQEYYGPMRARIAALRPGADPVPAAALDESEGEAALHDRFGDQYGYTLSVVRPA